MMKHIRNHMMLAAQMASASRAATRIGTVTSYDPNDHAAVVTLHPDDTLTGWLPIMSQWVGNSWGLFAPPSIGDLVEVQFVDDNMEVGFICQRFYTNKNRPLPVPAGEFWLVHKSGSLLKFHNDGSVELQAATDLNATVGGNMNATVTGNATTTATGSINQTAPTITLKGAIVLDGPISQANTAGSGTTANLIGPLNVTNDVTAGGKSLDHHTHTGVQPGSGTTGQPA